MVYHLTERCLIRVSGADAFSFLQSLVTQDIGKIDKEGLIYGCLLTPQGRFLHDFFISRDTDDDNTFFLECEAARRADLIRRLTVFKLRSKVSVHDFADSFGVYVSDHPSENIRSFPDPRLSALGWRFYAPPEEVGVSEGYRDMRIHLGVPEGSADIKPEMDTLSDVNLDHLNSISWDKGCYVGQEVTARMNYRALVKKRMMIVSGARLLPGAALTQNGHGVGDIRSVNAAGTEGLAVIKLDVLQNPSQPVIQPDGTAVTPRLPLWVKTA